MGEERIGNLQRGLRLDVNPWVADQIVSDALLYRGVFLAGWANVETTLIEIAIRASCDPHYSDHRDTYPSKLKSRVAYLDEILCVPGPLSKHASVARAVLQRYRKYEEFRNIMAHARMTILPQWGATFHFFQAKSGREITYKTLRLTQEQLHWYALRAARFSRAVRKLAGKVDAILPPLTAAE